MRIVSRLVRLTKNTGNGRCCLTCLLLATAASLIVPILIGDAVNNALHIDATTLIVTGNMRLLVIYGIGILVLSLLRGLFTFDRTITVNLSGRVLHTTSETNYTTAYNISVFPFMIPRKPDN